jgi:small subunit ribosomal protein S4e
MSKHLKRLAAPRAVHLHRKEKTWTIKPSPGPHDRLHTIPLGLLVREYLEVCDTYREAKKIIASGEVLVDGRPQKNKKFPCGLMDVISILSLKKDFRIVYDQKGKLALVPLSVKDAEWKLCRIENKQTLKGNKTQLNFHDGRNILVKKDEYKTGDVLKLSLKDNKISDTFKFDKGTVSMVIGGSHVGEIASIEEIQIVSSSKDNLAHMKSSKEFLTLAKYIFPIGKTKPVIQLPEVKM